ncbi:hypothetical protein EAO71_26990 [Streptomyces sp. ms191]|uniref:hypothetical protein n=1 Tax=Streptomyces sp. ms191 TaxID=1827978 RepID=UPI0011CEA280|nr:hypothetical protein [Streptomyces sp. ms191]TXS21753.1 hypothetical protein EAO71_26990 [Streptomyces sp. ms191]
MTTTYSESSTDRVPGRAWTIRLTGHADRTATLTCSTAGCRMPARSRDLAALRAFAARHAAAHAKAATVRPHASCRCRADHCETHADFKVRCSGGVVLIVRHDPSVGQVWSVEEVCEACAPLVPHALVVARSVRPRPVAAAPDQPTGAQVPGPARPSVPGGFSSAGAPGEGAPDTGPRRRRAPRTPHRRPGHER